MKWLLTILLGLAAIVVQAAQDPVRNYADSIVKLILAEDDSALYGEFSPRLKEKYSYTKFRELAASLREMGGRISSHSYSRTLKKVTVGPQGQLEVTSVLYSAVTSKYPADLFLYIDLASEGGRLYVIRYGWTKKMGPAPSPAAQTTGA